MAGDPSLWQLALLAAVYVIDLVVFIGLCRDELRERRNGEGEAPPLAASRGSDSAVMAH